MPISVDSDSLQGERYLSFSTRTSPLVCPASDSDGGISSRTSSTSRCFGGRNVVGEKAAAKFACVKVMGTIDANADDVYKLFQDNERVHVSVPIGVATVFWLQHVVPPTKLCWCLGSCVSLTWSEGRMPFPNFDPVHVARLVEKWGKGPNQYKELVELRTQARNPIANSICLCPPFSAGVQQELCRATRP